MKSIIIYYNLIFIKYILNILIHFNNNEVSDEIVHKTPLLYSFIKVISDKCICYFR